MNTAAENKKRIERSKKASLKVRKESMRVNREFERIEYDPKDETAHPDENFNGHSFCESLPPVLWGKERMGGTLIKNKIEFARKLRKHMTDAEIKIWKKLRGKQIESFRFRRQAPMGNYIVDFVCHESRLIIEIDGGQHNEQIEYDRQRTCWFETQGYMVKRFWNNDIFQQLDNVMEVIWDLCTSRRSPHPFLPPQNGGKGLTEAEST